MNFSAEQVDQYAASLGFRPDTLEKVLRLLSLLDTLRSNPYLRPRIALKGGTALNLFMLDVPRLSVDIDLNYIGSADRETMLTERPKVEQAIQAVCLREGLTVKRVPGEHAGGKWRLTFVNCAGTTEKLEVDLNFLLRVPLWPVVHQDSRAIGPFVAKQFPVMDRHELAAGKLAALCSRNASRDVFDAREILRRADLDPAKLRIAFVVYGGFNRKDWRTVTREDILADQSEFQRQLVPMLRATVRPQPAELASWCAELVSEVRELMSLVLPLADHEREFLDRLNGGGAIVPELLSDDPGLQVRIRNQPGLLWKALHVRQHAGAPADRDIP